MTSLDRMLAVLDLFEGSSLEWSFEDMHARLGYARSTLYRYLKSLTDAGLLTSLPGVGYTLGPRVAELDHQVRTRDPLIIASRPVMAELARDLQGVALLCRLYRDKVLCVHQERGTEDIRSSYERGLARPLLRGAASQIILAYLPSRTVRRLHAERPAEFAAELGTSLALVQQNLKRMRQAGWHVTHGEVTPGVTGIAAAVLDARGNVLGSLSVTVPNRSQGKETIEAIGKRVVASAAVVNHAIDREPAAPEVAAGQSA